ncbi:MAG: GTPase [archaeon]
MTTNAGPEYFKAKEKYEQAKTAHEKLLYLQEMHKFAPKHKASEKLLAELTWKIAQLRKEMEKEREQSKKSTGHSINIKKDGDGQIAILGYPNTGKSYLLKMLTNAEVEVAPYPFTTTQPEVGAMEYKGAKVQLVEVPAIVEGSSEGKSNGTQLLGLARNADALIITYTSDEEKSIVINELKKSGIIVGREKPRITIKQAESKGITIGGKQHLKMSEKELEDALKGFGIHKASILLEEETTMEKILEVLDTNLDYKNCLFLKCPFTVKEPELRTQIFGLLNKILVYTKKPGGKPDFDSPMVMKKGTLVEDVPQHLHKDMAKNMKYARIWGSTKFEGQRVSKDYELKDGDIIEIS